MADNLNFTGRTVTDRLAFAKRLLAHRGAWFTFVPTDGSLAQKAGMPIVAIDVDGLAQAGMKLYSDLEEGRGVAMAMKTFEDAVMDFVRPNPAQGNNDG
jgi:hypothetical protein